MRLNEFCNDCEHKSKDKNADEPCKRCAGTHIYSNYLFSDTRNTKILSKFEELDSKLRIVTKTTIEELVKLVIDHQLRTGKFDEIKDQLMSEQLDYKNLKDLGEIINKK